MKPDKDKDITERMVEMLRKHSFPYKEGAWERFKEYEASKNKKAVLWPYLSGAAAVVLLGIVLFLKPDRFDTSAQKQLVHTEESATADSSDSIEHEKVLSEDDEQLLADNRQSDLTNRLASENNKAPRGMAVTVAEPFTSSEKKQDIPADRNEQQYAFNNLSDKQRKESVQNNSIKDRATDQKTAMQQEDAGAGVIEPNGTYDQENAYQNGDWALNDGSEDHADLNQSLNKWDFSIELAPNINERQKVNFGGGVAIAYNINDKLSISSGVSYVQLDAQRGPNQVDIPAEFSKASLNSYNYNKSLNTINTTLVGLDIPVNLKVNLGSQIYASAGVSVFSVLSESRYNIFEEKIARVASVSGNGSGGPEPAIQTVYSQETNPDTPYEGKNFTGFFNLSVGYKLPVLKNLNLSVEPYLKVPVGSLTDQDMNLGNGGLKIVTSF